ncbi:hypothetical protein EDC01DRAFT_42712 [Geopyxis carbonaria]|nr:hypothetical protein EDC01DRAFT_42712 [Geopyxis carbonaria]
MTTTTQQAGLGPYIQSLFEQYLEDPSDLQPLNLGIDLAREATNDDDSESHQIITEILGSMLKVRSDIPSVNAEPYVHRYPMWLPASSSSPSSSQSQTEQREAVTAAQDRLREVLDYNDTLEEEIKSLRATTRILEEDLQAAGASTTPPATAAADTTAASISPSLDDGLTAQLREDCSCMICMNVVYKAPVTTQCCDTTLCAECLKSSIIASDNRAASCPNCRGTPRAVGAGCMFASIVRRILTDEEKADEALDSGRQREGKEAVNALLDG